MRSLPVTFLFAALVLVASAARAESQMPPDHPDSGKLPGPLSVSLASGQLYENFYTTPIYSPWALNMAPSFIVVAGASYRIYHFATLPLQFEGEVNIAKRWGEAHEFEFVLAPFLRWQSFPWNDVIYTNLRVSQLGLSYATGVSPWERKNSGNEQGSNFLQFAAAELTFAPNARSRVESYIGLHHRSGIYGAINGVSGGSNYVTIGFRVSL